MKIKYALGFVALMFALVGFVRCEREQGDCGSNFQPIKSSLTVAEAREFFEDAVSGSKTRSGAESPMPFVVGEASLNWGEAEASSMPHLASVDVPIDAEYVYYVAREDAAGNRYDVRADSKIIVVRSENSDRLESYVRTAIPDREYADIFYDQNICDMTLNCDDRVDYCGLEYYSTLDGRPIAVARYEYGVCTSSIFLYDPDISADSKAYQFGQLMGGMRIVRRQAGADTRVAGEWDYGDPWTVFISDSGTLYIYLDTDGDGKSDSVTTYDMYLEMIAGERVGGGGSGGSGSSGGYDGGYGSGNDGGGNSGSGGSGAGVGGGYGGGSSGSSGSSGGSGGSGSGGENNGDGGNSSGGDSGSGSGDPNWIILDEILPNPPNPLPIDKPNMDDRCPKCRKNPCICPKEEDCEKVAPEASDNAFKMTALHKQIISEPQYQAFTDSVACYSSIEYGTTGYVDSSNVFRLARPYTDSLTNRVRARLAKRPSQNITMVHNHPCSTPCSVGDVEALATLRTNDDRFRSIFVYTATGMEYVIYIYDVAKLDAFKNSEMYDKMHVYFTQSLDHLMALGHDANTAYLYALANMLSRLDTGIAILSKSENESMFHQHSAEITSFSELDAPEGFILIQCKPVIAQKINQLFNK